MNAAETIQAAIDKIEALQAASQPGPWHYHATILGLPSNTIFAAGGVVHEGYVGVAYDADLIVTLHRTIDAQLAILRETLAFEDGFGIDESDSTLALARAILGEVS